MNRTKSEIHIDLRFDRIESNFNEQFGSTELYLKFQTFLADSAEPGKYAKEPLGLYAIFCFGWSLNHRKHDSVYL